MHPLKGKAMPLWMGKQKYIRLCVKEPNQGLRWNKVLSNHLKFNDVWHCVQQSREGILLDNRMGLRGTDTCIGPRSSSSSHEAYEMHGMIVRSWTGSYQFGFLTNHHIAVALDDPNKGMFHPSPHITQIIKQFIMGFLIRGVNLGERNFIYYERAMVWYAERHHNG